MSDVPAAKQDPALDAEARARQEARRAEEARLLAVSAEQLQLWLYTQPCTCGGARFVRLELPRAHEGFGRAFRCACNRPDR